MAPDSRVRAVIFDMDGHHNNAVLTPEGWPTPAIAGRTIGIDTIAHGVLTAVRLPGGDVFQSARSER